MRIGDYQFSYMAYSEKGKELPTCIILEVQKIIEEDPRVILPVYSEVLK